MNRLRTIVAELCALYGPIAAPRLTAFELILFENASYLVDDKTRRRVFETLKSLVGVTPEAILACDVSALATVIAGGGMNARMRAEKLLECARLAAKIGAGKLNEKRSLQRFPGIGEPGADKILLLCSGVPSAAPDSNALRVLSRLGYAPEQRNYSQTYRLAIANTQAEISGVEDALAAHLYLRRHGQEICKRSAPRCEVCPVRGVCAWYQRNATPPPRDP